MIFPCDKCLAREAYSDGSCDCSVNARRFLIIEEGGVYGGHSPGTHPTTAWSMRRVVRIQHTTRRCRPVTLVTWEPVGPVPAKSHYTSRVISMHSFQRWAKEVTRA